MRRIRSSLVVTLAATAVVMASAATASAAPPDRTPPTVPRNLHVQTVSFTWLTLAWDPSTDNSGTVMYDAAIQTPAGPTQARAFGPTQSFGGLAAGTTYSASIRAVDRAGNSSAPVSIEVTTLARTVPPPSAPTSLRGVYTNGVLTGIAWDPSAPDLSYVLYSGDTVVFNGYETGVSVFELVFINCAVDLGSTHTLTVQAWAPDNYPSTRSAPLTVTFPLTAPTS